jgi:hypothetical protein
MTFGIVLKPTLSENALFGESKIRIFNIPIENNITDLFGIINLEYGWLHI